MIPAEVGAGLTPAGGGGERRLASRQETPEIGAEASGGDTLAIFARSARFTARPGAVRIARNARSTLRGSTLGGSPTRRFDGTGMRVTLGEALAYRSWRFLDRRDAIGTTVIAGLVQFGF